MTGMAVAFTLLFARINRGQPGGMRSVVRFGIGTVLYPLVALVGLLSAPLMLAIYAALSIYYMFNQAGTPEAARTTDS
jgi:hypothetical protein